MFLCMCVMYSSTCRQTLASVCSMTFVVSRCIPPLYPAVRCTHALEYIFHYIPVPIYEGIWMGGYGGYGGIQRDTARYTEIHRDTPGYTWIWGLQRGTVGCRWIQRDTAGYSGIVRDTAEYYENILQSTSRCIPLYPAVSRCISRCIPLYAPYGSTPAAVLLLTVYWVHLFPCCDNQYS